MARPQSQVDLMHVPTPGVIIDRLRELLEIPPGVRALDPCCGDGSALAALNPKGENYGIELDQARAASAEDVLGRVLACSMQEARVGHQAFGLVLLNPPYDASVEGRLEGVFLDRCSRYVAPGGVLVLIIKETMYPCVLRHLCRYFEPIGHWRFPDPYFDGPELAFGQTCLVVRRLHDLSWEHDTRSYAELIGLGSLEPMPEAFDEGHQVPIGHDPQIFLPGSLSERDLATLLSASPLAPKRMVMPPAVGGGRPPLPLKQGHISLVLASGLVNGVYGEGPLLHIAKGTIVRDEKIEHIDDVTVGGKAAVIERKTDFFNIVIRALRPNGEIHDLSAACNRLEEEATP